ncbi:hypothetical protein JMA_07450 [Jeotgalibacillus malaysiensis]|uniref:Uncharacterized protein n=1 Tax=Jeotgalibacillus malaysiensis TaxID=1508404 RepID=A0A0B5AN22_9BACL|nr:hypothetical protein JMA_07450 [Jeotgalibacillus malaysiensis]
MTGETPQTRSVEEAGMAPQNDAPAKKRPPAAEINSPL